MILDSTPSTGRLAAAVRGWPAYVVAQLLDRHLPAVLVAANRSAERGRIDPAHLTELRETWAALREAGQAWHARSEEAASPVSPRPGEAVRGSEEIDTATAADRLGVTRRRIRQLLADGALTGRQEVRRGHLVWIVNAASVREHEERWTSLTSW